ncbi:MAG TPA: hypothetical protein VGU25_13785 [Acidobacteriaceae bacterium]|nr:hypothetical protein [Acidobacteriaceae bacterium]
MPPKTAKVTPENELPPGNYVSEWLGHRVYPSVKMDVSQFLGKSFGSCPFLSEALQKPTTCVKNENSFGVCTVSSGSNGSIQDWLACPYRVISSDLIKSACERIFAQTDVVQPVPVTLLQVPPELQKFKETIPSGKSGYVFFQAKLGGEISVIGTSKSPEMSFDVTLVEVRNDDGNFKIGRYGIVEIQTMDFHGSYRAAVQNLRDALRLHRGDFPDALRNNMRWTCEGVEGPNIANVFKRTFYQILIKFQLAGQGAAAGTVLAIPEAVWDSWQPFLGAPELQSVSENVFTLKPVDDAPNSSSSTNAYITVFDLDGNADAAISPVRVKMHIKVDAEQLAHHAFKVVPSGMLKSLSEADSILTRIKERLAKYWPELI